MHNITKAVSHPFNATLNLHIGSQLIPPAGLPFSLQPFCKSPPYSNHSQWVTNSSTHRPRTSSLPHIAVLCIMALCCAFTLLQHL